MASTNGHTSSNNVALPNPGNMVMITPALGSSTPGCEQKDECYSPNPAVIRLGGTIILANTDSVAHTFTAGSLAGGTTGEFDTGLMAPNATFKYKPDMTGEIQYYCLVHPWKAGTIVVR